MTACDVWDKLMKKFFGANQLQLFNEFGKYMFLRQKSLYLLFRIQDDVKSMGNIYKERCKQYYEFKMFDKYFGYAQSHIQTE